MNAATSFQSQLCFSRLLLVVLDFERIRGRNPFFHQVHIHYNRGDVDHKHRTRTISEKARFTSTVTKPCSATPTRTHAHTQATQRPRMSRYLKLRAQLSCNNAQHTRYSSPSPRFMSLLVAIGESEFVLCKKLPMYTFVGTVPSSSGPPAQNTHNRVRLHERRTHAQIQKRPTCKHTHQ